MRKYEVMYIVRPDVEEAARKELITFTTEIFTKMDAKVLEVKEMGMRNLAYEIKDFTKGFYVLLNVEADSAACDEFDRLVKINESVIRHIVVRIDEVKQPVIKPNTRPKREARPAKTEKPAAAKVETTKAPVATEEA